MYTRINAKWINTEALTIKDSDGKIIFEVDVDKKSVYMNPDVLKIGDVALSEKIKNMDNSIAAAKNMTMILSNEYQAVAADANGKIEGTFPVIQTKVMVMYGSSDISADCSYTITKSAAVAGKWDETARTYTVTELNADDGWIDIKAVYLQNLSITKRFTVSKVRSGTNGKDGTPGRTYILEPSCNVLKRGSDKVISPNFLEFKAYYRDGNEATRHPYAGRFVVEETTDGITWNTIYTSSSDENTVKHYLYTILTDETGQTITDGNGTTIGIPRDITNIRCRLYQAGGTVNMYDMQSVAVVIDVDNLTQSQIVEILSNDGAWKGLYYKNGHLYMSFDAALGGELVLGGANNGNGTLSLRNADGNEMTSQTAEGTKYYNKSHEVKCIQNEKGCIYYRRYSDNHVEGLVIGDGEELTGIANFFGIAYFSGTADGSLTIISDDYINWDENGKLSVMSSLDENSTTSAKVNNVSLYAATENEVDTTNESNSRHNLIFALKNQKAQLDRQEKLIKKLYETLNIKED